MKNIFEIVIVGGTIALIVATIVYMLMLSTDFIVLLMTGISCLLILLTIYFAFDLGENNDENEA